MIYQLLLVSLSLVLEVCANYEYAGDRNVAKEQVVQNVKLDVYYESLCPDSINLYRNELYPVIKRFGPYVELHTYPYGKATTIVRNGTITFRCQHGEQECYGNKLHACALDHIGFNARNSWLEYNACMLALNSNDAAAERCGEWLGVHSKPIKVCAKGAKGTQLLKKAGEESAKVQYNYIPHVVIDGKPMVPHSNLFENVYYALQSRGRVPKVF